MTTEKGFPYMKMFSSLSGVRLKCRMSPSLNILCTVVEKQYYTKITMNLAGDVQFVYICPQNVQQSSVNRSRFNMSTVCPWP